MATQDENDPIELPPGPALEIKIPGTKQVLRIPARERTTLMYVEYNDIIGDSVTPTGFSWLMEDQKVERVQRDMLSLLLQAGGSLDTQTLFDKCWKPERWNPNDKLQRGKLQKAISVLKDAIFNHVGTKMKHPPFGIVDIVPERTEDDVERIKLVFDWDGED